MRGIWLLLPFLVGCVAPSPGGRCAGDFLLTNRSGREIEQLYAGGTIDLLDPGTMPSGMVRGFRAASPSTADLRVVFTDGRAAGIGPLDLCALPRVVVTASGIQPIHPDRVWHGHCVAFTIAGIPGRPGGFLPRKLA